jgi:hypothetical protein
MEELCISSINLSNFHLLPFPLSWRHRSPHQLRVVNTKGADSFLLSTQVEARMSSTYFQVLIYILQCLVYHHASLSPLRTASITSIVFGSLAVSKYRTEPFLSSVRHHCTMLDKTAPFGLSPTTSTCLPTYSSTQPCIFWSVAVVCLFLKFARPSSSPENGTTIRVLKAVHLRSSGKHFIKAM